jgi:hypothetical protein
MATSIPAREVRPGDVIELPTRRGELFVVATVRAGDEVGTVRLSVGRHSSVRGESSVAGVSTLVVRANQEIRRHGGG